jgi:hypothetical protein
MIIPRVPSANFAVFKNSSSREAEQTPAIAQPVTVE